MNGQQAESNLTASHWLGKVFLVVPFYVFYRLDYYGWFILTVLVIGAWTWSFSNDYHRKQRSPYYVIWMRMCLVIGPCIGVLCWLMNQLLDRTYWTFFSGVGLAFAAITFYCVWQHFGTKPIAYVAAATIRDYQFFHRSGGHLFWDCTLRIFNPDSDMLRETGMREPAYTNFVPPADWLFQCPQCGARVAEKITICWNCNYGADGSSAAYAERWGYMGVDAIPQNDLPPEALGPDGPYVPTEPRT